MSNTRNTRNTRHTFMSSLFITRQKTKFTICVGMACDCGCPEPAITDFYWQGKIVERSGPVIYPTWDKDCCDNCGMRLQPPTLSVIKWLYDFRVKTKQEETILDVFVDEIKKYVPKKIGGKDTVGKAKTLTKAQILEARQKKYGSSIQKSA